MDELETLEQKVSSTLRRARERTGVMPQGSPRPGRLPHRPDRLDRVVRAVEQQRSICARLRDELAAVRAGRKRQQDARGHQQQEQEVLSQELEIVARAVELAGARRQACAHEAREGQDRLARLRASKTDVALTVLEAHDACARIFSRLRAHRRGTREP